MGSTIAAHLANVGIPTYLLDIIPRDVSEEEAARGLTLEDKVVRNRLADQGKKGLLKAKPAALYSKENADLITAGNFQDDMEVLKNVDWIIEVVVENLSIMKRLMNIAERGQS